MDPPVRAPSPPLISPMMTAIGMIQTRRKSVVSRLSFSG
jgi:hypothetical protein